MIHYIYHTVVYIYCTHSVQYSICVIYTFFALLLCLYMLLRSYNNHILPLLLLSSPTHCNTCLYMIIISHLYYLPHPYYYPFYLSLLQDILKGALSLYPLSVTPTMDIEAVTAGIYVIGAPLSLTHVKVRFFRYS